MDKGDHFEEMDTDEEMSLTDAASQGDIATVQSLLKTSCDVNAKDSSGWSPVMLAASNGQYNTVMLLVKHNADILDVYKDGSDALLIASSKGHARIVALLLEYNADVSLRNKFGFNAIMAASLNGHMDTVNTLIPYCKDFSTKNNHGQNALMLASTRGHYCICEVLLQRTSNLNNKDRKGNNALCLAAMRGHTRVVELLMDESVDINTKNNLGRTALMEASLNGWTETVEFLLERNANINLVDKDGFNALMLACSKGHIDTVKLLLRKNSDRTAMNDLGNNSLIIASKHGHDKIVKLLLSEGLDSGHVNKMGRNSLIEAARFGHEDAVKILNRTSDLNYRDNNGWTALMWAAFEGHASITRVLLKGKASMEQVNNEGSNAFILAANNGSTQVISLIFQEDKDVLETKNEFGRTALMEAAFCGRLEAVQYLLNVNADIHVTENKGWNSLMLAASKGHNKIVELLLQRNIDKSAVNNMGDNACIIASKTGHTRVVELLLENSADINVVNSLGRTALMEAAYNGQTETAEFLISKNADLNCKDKDGNNALMLSASKGHASTVKRLLHHFDVAEDALKLAIKGRHSDVMKIILKMFNFSSSNISSVLKRFSFEIQLDLFFLFQFDKNVPNLEQPEYTTTYLRKYLASPDTNLDNAKRSLEIMRKLYDSQQKREVLKMKDLKLHIKTVMREFSKATKLDVFEFFIYQKCFAMIHNLIFKKSLTICNSIGKYLVDRCYAEFTVKYIRELQLLDTSEPNVIPTLIHVTLVTMKGFSNYNSFAKSLAQQEIIPLLNQYITICSNETLDEEQTTNVKQAIGILLNISIKASKKIHNIKTDPAFIFLQLVKWNLKNRSSFVFNMVETGPFLATKGEIKLIEKWIKKAILAAKRMYDGYTMHCLVKCLAGLTIDTETLYNMLLGSRPNLFDCLEYMLDRGEIDEQRAALDCVKSLSKTTHGKYIVKGLKKIVGHLEVLSTSKSNAVRSKTNTILWLVKRESLNIQNDQKFLAPGLTKNPKKSTFIGQGQFGMVYKIKMDDAFVLKEIKLNKEEIKKEKQEIDILLHLEHRRIVPFYGYEIKENALLLYFQNMEKGSLDTFIDANGVLSEKQTCLYTRQILDGLNYLHLHKPQIIHRDIKGGNILMENSSSVKLSDFGVSKIISELTEARTHAGTFKWMAPEIILGETAPYTVKADIWSVGCTVVEMLTGKPPFHNLEHPQRILKMYEKTKPQYQLNPEASQELHGFLDAIFIYSPSDRPSAYELIDHPYVAFKYQADAM